MSPIDDERSDVLASRVKHLFRARSFNRYFIIGFLNTLGGMFLFTLVYFLLEDTVEINLLTALGWLLNNILGFIFHRSVTFESSDPIRQSMPKFFLLSFSGLAFNLIVLNIVLHFFNLSPIVILCISTIMMSFIIMVMNYFGMDRLVFKNSKPS